MGTTALLTEFRMADRSDDDTPPTPLPRLPRGTGSHDATMAVVRASLIEHGTILARLMERVEVASGMLAETRDDVREMSVEHRETAGLLRELVAGQRRAEAWLREVAEGQRRSADLLAQHVMHCGAVHAAMGPG